MENNTAVNQDMHGHEDVVLAVFKTK